VTSPRLLGLAFLLGLSPLVVVHPVRVSGRSMEPGLGNGAVRLAMRAWCAGAPRPGQVWLVTTPSGTVVKRLAAGPGTRVELREGSLWVDGRPVPQTQVAFADRASGGPWDTGQGWFLLGDNRPLSHDSRAYGPVPGAALEARILGGGR
jgi:signal peptidase I